MVWVKSFDSISIHTLGRFANLLFDILELTIVFGVLLVFLHETRQKGVEAHFFGDIFELFDRQHRIERAVEIGLEVLTLV